MKKLSGVAIVGIHACVLTLSFAHAANSATLRPVSVAAPAELGALTGKVVDGSTGLPINAAIVTVKGTPLRQSTDGDGFFLIEKVPAGGVVIEVSRPGYKSRELSVSVTPGEPTTWTIALARLNLH